MEFTSLKGFKDILPQEAGHWRRLKRVAAEVFTSFGFREIQTPILEWTELFSRGIGQETDIVSKEMYTLTDSRGRGMTLRPEATASVVRAYIEHRLYQDNPVQKLFSIGPMFRRERPQKGRFRQFHQINAELFGDPGAQSDADIIAMAMCLMEALGLDDLTLHLNTLGDAACRPRFREQLVGFLKHRMESLCDDCRRRALSNPLRVFDCKVEGCRDSVSDAPSVLDFLCDDCRRHFDALKESMTVLGIRFVINPRLVRGLDYYNRTTFEIQTERLGAQNAVAGGGRYDGLIRLLGGPDHPAIGFAVGMERLIALLEAEGGAESRPPDLFVAALGEPALKTMFPGVIRLRKMGLQVEMSYGPKGLKAQMRQADRLRAKRVLIVGDAELASGIGLLRDMATKEQFQLPLENGVERLAELLGGAAKDSSGR